MIISGFPEMIIFRLIGPVPDCGLPRVCSPFVTNPRPQPTPLVASCNPANGTGPGRSPRSQGHHFLRGDRGEPG